MNNSNQNMNKDFKIVSNMKMYFQNNICQMQQHIEEESQLEITSNSDYVLLPDLSSMVLNLVDLQRNDFDQSSINQSMYILSSTDVSSNKNSMILQSMSDNSFTSNLMCEEF